MSPCLERFRGLLNCLPKCPHVRQIVNASIDPALVDTFGRRRVFDFRSSTRPCRCPSLGDSKEASHEAQAALNNVFMSLHSCWPELNSSSALMADWAGTFLAMDPLLTCWMTPHDVGKCATFCCFASSLKISWFGKSHDPAIVFGGMCD